MAVRIKRAYEHAEALDGERILVDRRWPRGIRKSKAHINAWAKELAPSTALRTEFHHDPGKWQGFKARYLQELLENKAAIQQDLKQVFRVARTGTVTFIYGAKDELHNNAVALKEFFDKKLLRP